jgi:hypothetical protein
MMKASFLRCSKSSKMNTWTWWWVRCNTSASEHIGTFAADESRSATWDGA